MAGFCIRLHNFVRKEDLPATGQEIPVYFPQLKFLSGRMEEKSPDFPPHKMLIRNCFSCLYPNGKKTGWQDVKKPDRTEINLSTQKPYASREWCWLFCG